MSDNKIVYDEFADVVAGTHGIFDNSAMGEFSKVKTAATPEGVKLEFSCQGCNTAKQVVLEWPEVISLKFGLDPAFAFRGRSDVVQAPMSFQYLKDEHAWAPGPNEKCQNCEWHYGIRVYPNEPEDWLRAGRRAGYIRQNWEQPMGQYVQSVAQGVRAQMQVRR